MALATAMAHLNAGRMKSLRLARSLQSSRPWWGIGLAGMLAISPLIAATPVSAQTAGVNPASVLLLQQRQVSSLEVTLSPTRMTTVVGKRVAFVASVHGTALLRSITVRFGDGSTAQSAGTNPSCAAGTSLHVSTIVMYHHTYRRSGHFHVQLSVRTVAKPTGCKAVTTIRTAAVTVTKAP